MSKRESLTLTGSTDQKLQQLSDYVKYRLEPGGPDSIYGELQGLVTPIISTVKCSQTNSFDEFKNCMSKINIK